MVLAKQQFCTSSNLMIQCTQCLLSDSMYRRSAIRILNSLFGISEDKLNLEVCGITTMKEVMQSYMCLTPVTIREYSLPNRHSIQSSTTNQWKMFQFWYSPIKWISLHYSLESLLKSLDFIKWEGNGIFSLAVLSMVMDLSRVSNGWEIRSNLVKNDHKIQLDNFTS